MKITRKITRNCQFCWWHPVCPLTENQTILKNGPKKTCLKIHEIGQKKLRHFIISVYKPPPTAPPPCGWPLKMISNDCLCPKTFIWTPEPCF